MFIKALLRDQIEFVKLFLDNDFSLMAVFDNEEVLQSLYDNDTNGVRPIERSSKVDRSHWFELF